jgi:signal transduction histidine kinase
MELSRMELSLERVATEAVDAQRPNAARKKIRLGLAVAPSPPVLADRHRVDEMLENLLSNALKFTEPGGSVEVAVRPADGQVRLEVSDTGAGISAEDQVHLFEEFFRSPDMVGKAGVGLGLSIVKALADAHDATLSVRSTLGEGTTFGLEFPAAGSPQPAC